MDQHRLIALSLARAADRDRYRVRTRRLGESVRRRPPTDRDLAP